MTACSTGSGDDERSGSRDDKAPRPVPTPVEIESLSIDANGFVFDALAAGPTDGDLVLLLHGFPQTSYEWRAQLLALGRAGYRAVAPDQRGYSAGARPEGDDQYAMSELVDDVMAIADELGADEFHLVGHDWGAAVAWVGAITEPDRVVSLAAVSVPHPGAYSEATANPDGEQRSKQGYIETFVRPGAAAALTADVESFLAAALGDVGTDDAIAEYAAVLGSPEAMDSALAWYRANDLRDGVDAAAPAVTVPTLFVFGTDDCCLGRDAADLTERYVTGPYRYEVLDGVSHWIPEETPERLSELLVDHVSRHADR